jgi:hypothetical protein
MIDEETARLTHAQVGSQYICWFQCQPELEAVQWEAPDVFDDC